MNLLDELSRRGPLKYDRSKVKAITFDTSDGRAKVKDQKIFAEEQSIEERVRVYLSTKEGHIVSAKGVAKELGMAWQTAANEVVKFWRRGFLESRREKKKMFYLVGKL